MSFTVFLSSNAQKFLRSLNVEQQLVIEKSIVSLSEDPYQGKLLSGSLKGLRSWRTSKYRIIYEINQEQLRVLVVDIGLRKKVYK